MPEPEWILALDVAISTGYALRNVRTGELLSGTLKYRKRKGHRYGTRFIQFDEALDSFLTEYPLLYVAFEQPMGNFKSYAAALSIHGFIATLLTWCARNEIDFHGYPQTDLKKFATGNGNANKDMMLAAARAKWPDQQIETDDQADACWVLELDSAKSTTTS